MRLPRRRSAPRGRRAAALPGGTGLRARLARAPWGVRRSAMLVVALGSAGLVAAFATTAYLVVRDDLIAQREEAVTDRALLDASSIRESLLTAGAQVDDAIARLGAPADADVLVVRGGENFSSSFTHGIETVPPQVRAAVADGEVARGWWRTADGPVLAVGVPLPAVDAQFYEVTRAGDLESTLTTLRAVLGVCALGTAVGGAMLGRWVAGRVVAPLRQVARTAARIAGGELGTRVPATDDPDLVTIVASINSMVDALNERIDAEARFTADVSHELRSPLTTLVTSVGVLQRRREELSVRSRRALDLVGSEVVRFQSTVEDLLALGRFDAGATPGVRVPTDAGVLVEQTLVTSGRSAGPLTVGGAGRAAGAGGADLLVDVDRAQVARALVNLFDNADRHGEGLRAVSVQRSGAAVLVRVDDDGPGVPDGESGRIFQRFARAGSRHSLPGSGLGLSLVDETVRAHGGAVWAERAPGGGARFVVKLPGSRAAGAGAPRAETDLAGPAEPAALPRAVLPEAAR